MCEMSVVFSNPWPCDTGATLYQLSYEEWSSQLWSQFLQLRKEAWKKFRTSTGLEPVTSRIPVRRSTNWAMKPLTLGAGQLWVHMFPWKICKWMMHMKEIICELRMWNQMKNDPRSYDRNFYNCVKKPEKNSGLQRGLNPWPSRYRCDALPTELWSHWRWEQVNFGFICSRERYVSEWCIWNKSYVNCGYEIKWRMILAVMIAIFTIA